MTPTLETYMRDFLVAQGLVRDPRVAPPSVPANQLERPPLWIEKVDGYPAPGDDEGLKSVEVGRDMVLGAYRDTGIPTGPHQGFISTDCVSIIYRAKKPYQAFDHYRQLRLALNDQHGWDMAGLFVAQSMVIRELQRTRHDKHGWTGNCEISFDVWA